MIKVQHGVSKADGAKILEKIQSIEQTLEPNKEILGEAVSKLVNTESFQKAVKAIESIDKDLQETAVKLDMGDPETAKRFNEMAKFVNAVKLFSLPSP